MLTMLTVSSIGNLVLLPALLAGPAGHFFWKGGDRTRHGAKGSGELPADGNRPTPTIPALEEPVGETRDPLAPSHTRKHRPHAPGPVKTPEHVAVD